MRALSERSHPTAPSPLPSLAPLAPAAVAFAVATIRAGAVWCMSCLRRESAAAPAFNSKSSRRQLAAFRPSDHIAEKTSSISMSSRNHIAEKTSSISMSYRAPPLPSTPCSPASSALNSG